LAAGFGLGVPLPFGTAFVRPAYSWKSRVYFEEEWQQESFLEGEAPGLYQDGYGVLRVRAGVTTADGRGTFEVFADNVLDTRYIVDAGNTGLIFYAPTYIPGPPRMLGLRMTARF
jgi:outer membrane receptor protein involved in Fe transport